MRSSAQKRIAEQNGVFDLAGRPGVAPTPPAAPAAKAPAAPAAVAPVPPAAAPSAPKPQPGKDAPNQVNKLIDTWTAIRRASMGLETAAAIMSTIKGGGKESSDELNKVRAVLLNTLANIKANLIELGDKDETVAARIRAWLTGGSDEQEKAPAASAPAPTPPAAPPATPAAPTAPLLTQAPAGTNAAAIPGMPQESFLRRLDKALVENGVTKEKKQTDKPKTKVWQAEKTGTKKHWYTGGVKGNSYGTGGKFNDH